MKKLLLAAITTLLLASSLYARDDVTQYSIAEAMELEQTKLALGSEIKFYFGNQTHSSIASNFGEFRTNKKTNAFNKSDKEACQWVFLSAMISLRDRAVTEGGNAVINIKSNYKNNLTVSDTTFSCGSGAIIAGVALVGTIVKLD
jgi:uncharacterized protein YbjQ (UPF0145 family)